MKHINFVRFIPFYFTLSAIVLGAGIFSLLRWGLRPSVDFVGGSLVEVTVEPKEDAVVSESTIRDSLSSIEVDANTVQSSGEQTWTVRTKSQEEDLTKKLTNVLTERLGATELVRFESVGPTLGRELLKKTLVGILLSAGGILLYVAWRFKGGRYGVCAILAMLHDSLVVIGAFSLLGHFYGIEVDTLFVTALLTILSFSVHDTIVVYDRIRENLRSAVTEDFETIVNKSVTETMRRSINNSLTILFMLVALTVWGGTTIRPFAFALLIGTITGTYSSPFTAVPLLVVWGRFASRRRKKK
jgi:preprotein translocase subunit SecF